MKNVSLILNAVLFILVGILFYLHFSNHKPVAKPIVDSNGKAVQGMVIAYFDIDSFQNSYEYYKVMKKDLENRQNIIESELAKDEQSLQNLYTSLQQKAETMTEAEANEAQQQLMMKKDQLDQKKEDRSNQLMSQTQKFNEELQDSLISFLKEYNVDGRYAYIMPYSKESPLLMYVNPAYDITGDVIKGMNDKYKNKK